VVLAQLLGETRRPPDWLWDEELVASRLLQYELWNRTYAYGCAEELASDLATVFGPMLLMELEAAVLARALDAIPGNLGIFDSLYLATACFIQPWHPSLRLASYDRRLSAPVALSIPLVDLDGAR
jgi:hypothetical protein